jgi:hypothetical protein
VGWSARAAKRLVARGADLSARDTAFNATPCGWAGHFHNADVEAFLRAAQSSSTQSMP